MELGQTSESGCCQGKKKKFIDKKNALNFEVVHRDQRDPLTADENAPQMLLKQVDLRQKKTVSYESSAACLNPVSRLNSTSKILKSVAELSTEP